MDRMAAVFLVGSRCKIITTSLFTPVTPSEHSPNALFCSFRAHREVEPTRTTFSTPDGGTATRSPTFTREI